MQLCKHHSAPVKCQHVRSPATSSWRNACRLRPPSTQPRSLQPLRTAQHRLRPQERAPLEAPCATSNKAQPGDAEAPPWLKKIIGSSEYSTKFRLRRWLLFSGLVLGYSFYYLCRNSLNYVLPVMVNDKALGLTITQLATMTSIFPIAYGAYLLHSQNCSATHDAGTRVCPSSMSCHNRAQLAHRILEAPPCRTNAH